MTAQDIQAAGFERAVFGGYDMKAVDEFLEECAEALSTLEKEKEQAVAQCNQQIAELQQENASLKAKLKILVDKVEEYRGVEDGMRRTLMTAQSIAQEMTDKAKTEAEQMRIQAEQQSEAELRETRQAIEQEKQRLELAKEHTVNFIARISAVYRAQAKALIELANQESLPRPTAAPPKAHTEEPDITEQPPTPEELPEQRETEPVEEEIIEVEPEQEDTAEYTRKYKFNDLKFGAEYDPTAR